MANEGSFQAGGGETVFHFHSGVKGLDRQAARAGCEPGAGEGDMADDDDSDKAETEA